MTTAPSPGGDLKSLIAEYEASTTAPTPHYRSENEIQPRGEATVVAENGEMLPKPVRLTFSAPPPEEVPINEIDSMLQPLRERLTAAEDAYARAADDARARDAVRVDIERAAAAIRNVSADPMPRMQRPDPAKAMRMSDAEWDEVKAAAARGEY